MRFYFMLHCKLQRYNHTSTYVLECENVEHVKGHVSIYTDVSILPFGSKLIWFHR